MGDGSFVHLHVHTEYSMLDGAAKLGPMFAEVERLAMPALGMTDHGNMYGAYDFYQRASAAGIKPIIGVEAYVAPDSRYHKKPVFWGERYQRERGDDVSGNGAYTHLTLLAENTKGLRNLFQLSSKASLEGYYYKPRMDRELLAEHAGGIIATTGCPSGEVQTRLRLDQGAEALQAAADLCDIFGRQNVYVELMDHGLDIERGVREGLLSISKSLGIRPLATNDSHYVHREDAKTHEALLCVQSGKTLADPKRFKFDGDGYYIKSPEEMRSMWDHEVAGACDSSLLIAERVQSYEDVFGFVDRMPRFPVPEGEDQASWFRREVERGLVGRFPGGVPESHRSRADYEIDVILQMGFPAYFLVVADLVGYAKKAGIRVGPGRGSATGCVCAYALGITELDPLEHGLLFERFLNPERVSMPDIDLDFDERRRGDMIRYVTERWGEDRVAQIITYGTIKAKAALKDSARVLYGQPGYSIADRISKSMPPAVMGKDIPLSGVFDPAHPRYSEAVEVRSLHETDPQVKEIVETARGLEGMIRQAGVHAAGVILSSEPLVDVLPVWRREADGAVVTQWDFPSCESVGLLKMDLLGLRNLTVLDDAIANVEANHGRRVDLDTLALDDKKTYELLARGDTLGVFQLDGGPMRALLKAMAPTAFEDIAAVLALYRPGPMAANAHNDYADRKNNRKPVVPIHEELAEPLDDILGETFGLIVYQEQVMAIAQKVAGYSLGSADLLRRAMGKKKKEILHEEFKSFSSGMQDRRYSVAAVNKLWEILLPFAGYAFNKSHTAGYGLVSYWTAYLKANHPAEYMAALLTSVGDDKDKAAVYLAECRKMGITVLPPDVNTSDRDFTPVGTDIRFGLGAIRNVGGNVVDAVTRARTEKGRYADFSDFLRKVDAVVCNKKVVESLVKAGAFDSLGHSRKGLHLVHAEAIDAVMESKRAEAVGQFDLFGDAPPGTGGLFDIAIPGEEWDGKHRLALEREMLGLYVSGHPLHGVEHVLANQSDTPIASILDGTVDDGAQVVVGGILASVTRRVNKNGEPWASSQLEDLAGGIEVLFFPKTYSVVGLNVAEDAIVLVKARVAKRDDRISLIANDLVVPELNTAGAAQPVRVSMPAARCTPLLVAEFKDVLARHPGTQEVHLNLVNGGRTHQLRLDDGLRVTPSSALMGDLKALLGPSCLS
ncbi:MAG: DNA polymerase III subunit alpha [Pseudonocardiaceae bacterium]